MKLSKIISILVVLVLLGLSVKNSLTVTMNGVRATAECISEPRRDSSRSRSILSARESEFRFKDENGDKHEASIWFSLTRPKAGEQVDILYAKDNPQLIYYDSVLFVWILPAILGILLLFPLTRLFLRRAKSAGNTDQDS